MIIIGYVSLCLILFHFICFIFSLAFPSRFVFSSLFNFPFLILSSFEDVLPTDVVLFGTSLLGVGNLIHEGEKWHRAQGMCFIQSPLLIQVHPTPPIMILDFSLRNSRWCGGGLGLKVDFE